MHIYKSDTLNGFPLYSELTLLIKKYLLNDFIRLFPGIMFLKNVILKETISQFKILFDDFGFQ